MIDIISMLLSIFLIENMIDVIDVIGTLQYVYHIQSSYIFWRWWVVPTIEPDSCRRYPATVETSS